MATLREQLKAFGHATRTAISYQLMGYRWCYCSRSMPVAQLVLLKKIS
ncbi:MAG: hypothetical protein F6J98_09875 [Moorea sp. SIO4G2]|nr:hypothetical protein [Moorena sp. SIO4G2]